MMTAAAPTKLCSIAMSSGICVISTVRARQVPTAAPNTSTSTMSRAVTQTVRSDWSSASTIVATIATPMPTIPRRFPRRAFSCLDRPASERMNRTAATR